ncbi:serine hydrolase domain-containing protein [Actinomadura fibrosa]|uniref:Serine hydrolase domain-containing protein n=1 Tax=Actinomadura fibrosa TaxID=111802 RepID=A0ABW2XE40_9ACTN|nr:serine hydrolase domain-containing protein [Actinomadura fibrosa]
MSYKGVRPRLRWGALAAGVAMLVMAPASPATAARLPVGNVQKAMDGLARTPGVVGAIGGVYVDGRPAGAGTAGSRLLNGEGGTIPADSRFAIGSQTKAMVATALLQLVEEGRVGLDDKLAALLPEVAGGLVERADEITVRQLIQHTSGIPDFWSKDGSSEPSFDVFDFTTYYRPIDVVATTRGRPRTGEPGETFAYSNTNYTLLGMIIERVTGRTLAAELDRRLFRPLGMTRSYALTRPPDGIKGPHGHGYYPDSTGTLRDMDHANASWGFGAGNVVSTTHDVSAFQRALDQGRLLPPSLQAVLTGGAAGGKVRQRADGCVDDLYLQGGSGIGYTTLMLYTGDGRRQFEISVTRSVDDATVIPEMAKAGQAVLCPTN